MYFRKYRQHINWVEIIYNVFVNTKFVKSAAKENKFQSKRNELNRNGTQKCIGDGVVMTSRPAPRVWHLAYEIEMRAHTHASISTSECVHVELTATTNSNQ